MENRMTVCNMSIEGGARAGLIAPDDTTYNYLRGRPHAPQGAEFDKAVARWRKLPTDPARSTTSRWCSMARRSRRKSAGAPIPGKSFRSPAACQNQPTSRPA